ncbi:MAG: IreB family regulatory phosphoprotein [Acetobacteraceae bacterium]|nr:IreB family regulatory phosphoprotein [Acetobacteraceae bacterium]
MRFRVKAEVEYSARDILRLVYQALKEKGHNPVDQIVGYLLSGDPAYITSHRDARTLVRRLERDELLAELVRHYLEEEKGA